MTDIGREKSRSAPGTVALALYAAAFAVLFGKTILGMGAQWYADPNYSHGFLIPLISGWLIWRGRRDLAEVPRVPSAEGIAVAVAGFALFLAGNLTSEYFTMRLAMLTVLAGSIIWTAGGAFFRAILFPFSYLLFMIPLPYLVYDSFAFPLKILVSKISVRFLQLIGVAVLREGNIITFASTTLEVADACSGIRSIVSLLALAAAMAYFTQRGWLKRLVLTVMAIPIAILANAVRIIITGILASRYGGAAAEGFFHEFTGLLIFGLAAAMLIATGLLLGLVGRGE